MSKKVIGIFLIVIIITSAFLSVSTFASERRPAGLMWDYTSSCRADLDSSGTTLYPSSSVIATSTSYKISGTLYLERKNGSSWVTEKSWAISGTGISTTEKEWTGAKGNTYRARVSAKVNGENVSATSSQIKL